jgi:hypothetical protein
MSLVSGGCIHVRHKPGVIFFSMRLLDTAIAHLAMDQQPISQSLAALPAPPTIQALPTAIAAAPMFRPPPASSDTITSAHPYNVSTQPSTFMRSGQMMVNAGLDQMGTRPAGAPRQDPRGYLPEPLALAMSNQAMQWKLKQTTGGVIPYTNPGNIGWSGQDLRHQPVISLVNSQRVQSEFNAYWASHASAMNFINKNRGDKFKQFGQAILPTKREPRGPAVFTSHIP